VKDEGRRMKRLGVIGDALDAGVGDEVLGVALFEDLAGDLESGSNPVEFDGISGAPRPLIEGFGGLTISRHGLLW